MNQTQVQTAVSTMLSDTLSQITADVLQNAVTEAWGDAWVATPVWNTDLTFSINQYEYPLSDLTPPINTVEAVYIQRSPETPASFPEEISDDYWQVVDGNIIFSRGAGYTIPDGFQLQLRGRYKLSPTDDLPIDNYALQNYVINLAAWIVLRALTYKKALAFLNNDTSMSELLSFRQAVEHDIQRYRAQLQQAYISA